MWVPLTIAAIVAAIGVFEGDSSAGGVIGDVVGALLGTALQIAFWTTLVFSLIDRFSTDEVEAWTPDLLPAAPTDRSYSFGEAATGISWNLILGGFLVLQQFRTWVAGDDGNDVPVLDPDLWSGLAAVPVDRAHGLHRP